MRDINVLSWSRLLMMTAKVTLAWPLLRKGPMTSMGAGGGGGGGSGSGGRVAAKKYRAEAIVHSAIYYHLHLRPCEALLTGGRGAREAAVGEARAAGRGGRWGSRCRALRPAYHSPASGSSRGSSA